MQSKMQKGFLVVLVGLIIWFLPVPAGVKPEAWKLLAIFVATILGFILQPMPIGAIALISVGITGFLKVVKPADILSGFCNTTIR